jgi:hypothetical protein
LNMRTSSQILVVAAFSARLPVIAISTLRLVYLRDTFLSSDRTLAGSYYVVCTQSELGYAIMSSSLTGLGPFLRPFSRTSSTSYRRSSYSHDTSKAEPSQDSGNLSKTNEPLEPSYELSSLKAKRAPMWSLNRSRRNGNGGQGGNTITQASFSSEIRASDELVLRPDLDSHEYNTSVSGGDCLRDEEDDMCIGSHERHRIMVTKMTKMKVEVESA